MPVEIVRKLGLMPAAITDSYTVGTPSDLQKSKGRGFATHTVLTSATTAGTTDVLSVENGFICKTSDVLIVESDAGSEEVTVHATTAPTATSITLAAAVTLSHTTTNSKVYVKEGRVVADHDGTSYSSGSLLMLPAVDVYQSSKANLCTVTESSTAGTADLKTFYRSGSTSTIDTVETLAEKMNEAEALATPWPFAQTGGVNMVGKTIGDVLEEDEALVFWLSTRDPRPGNRMERRAIAAAIRLIQPAFREAAEEEITPGEAEQEELFEF